MLAQERHRVIVGRLKQAGSVRVVELARDLSVTEETIRRDLERLDTDGKLVRIHGGAMALEELRSEIPFDVRRSANQSAKRVIASRALRHVRESDVIGIDASSTAAEFAALLPDAPLTVITNSLTIAISLANRPRIRVISTGGVLDGPSRSFVGAAAEHSLDRYHIGTFFFSCAGVDLERGLSVAGDEHARIKRKMMDLSDTNILLVDRSKFGIKSVVFFAALAELDAVITEDSIESGLKSDFSDRQINVEYAS